MQYVKREVVRAREAEEATPLIPDDPEHLRVTAANNACMCSNVAQKLLYSGTHKKSMPVIQEMLYSKIL